jgi:hypothetical protein
MMGRGNKDSNVFPGEGNRNRFVVTMLNVPFEFVGKVAGACTVAEARHVEGSAAAGHGGVGVTRRIRKPAALTDYDGEAWLG